MWSSLRRARRPATLVAAVALLASGCASSSSPSPAASTAPGASTASSAPSEAATSAPSPSASSGLASLTSVTLTVWYGANVPDAQKKLVDKFATATGATMNVIAIPDPLETNVLSKFAGGDRPDILYWHDQHVQMETLDPANNLQDLSSLDFVAKTPPNYLTGVTFSGVRGAVLRPPDVTGILYNKDIFTKLGLTPPTNWADVMTLCSGIKTADPSVAPMFIGVSAQFTTQYVGLLTMAQVWKDDPQFFDNVNSNKGKWTDPKIVNALTAFEQIRDQKCLNKDFLTATFPQELQALVDGKAAMLPFDDSVIPLMIQNNSADKVNATVGYAPVSLTSNVAGFGFGASEAVVAPKTGDATREAAAIEFINWATSQDVYQSFINDLGVPPALTGFDTPASVPLVVSQATTAATTNGTEWMYDLNACSVGTWHIDAGSVLAGKETAQQLAQYMQTQWEQSCKAKNQPGF